MWHLLSIVTLHRTALHDWEKIPNPHLLTGEGKRRVENISNIKHFDFSGGCLRDSFSSCLNLNADKNMKEAGSL